MTDNITEKENSVSDSIANGDELEEELDERGSISEDSDSEEISKDNRKSDDEESVEENPAAELENRLNVAEQEAKSHHEKFLRLYAEFENYKKRTARELGEFRKYANESLVKELIPVVDNLERAITSSEEETQDKSCILEGVELTRKEILRVLEKYEVKPIDALGMPFDPNFHEAVGQEESETEGDNIVVRELLKGYTMHNRLIRPSMVIVSKAKPAENA